MKKEPKSAKGKNRKPSLLKRLTGQINRNSSTKPKNVVASKPAINPDHTPDTQHNRDEPDVSHDFLMQFYAPGLESAQREKFAQKLNHHEQESTIVEPTHEADETSQPIQINTSNNKEEADEDVINEMTLPNEVWLPHIFSRLNYSDIVFFSRTCKAAHELYLDFLGDQFSRTKFDADDFFKKAYNKGVTLNEPLLHRLCLAQDACSIFLQLHFVEQSQWVIAAMSGDVQWLKKTYGQSYTQLKVTTDSQEFSIMYYLAYAGHLPILKQDFSTQLAAIKGSKHIQLLLYAAGITGQFHVCDYLVEHYSALPNVTSGSLELTTAHFYAKFGEQKRLQTILEQDSELLTRFPTHCSILFYAVMGGSVDTVKFLTKNNPNIIIQPDNVSNENYFHIAAKQGHAQLLTLFIDEFKLEPPQDPCVAGSTPLDCCAESASWECFWILYPYYQQNSNITQSLTQMAMNAISYNHREFFDQLVAHFFNNGAEFIYPDDWRMSHYAVFSYNVTTIRKLRKEYNLDLTEKNDKGQTALLVVAADCADTHSDITWKNIAKILSAFNGQFDNTLHLIPDNDGLTLEALIKSSGKEHLFSFLGFEKERTVQAVSVNNHSP